MTVYKSPCEYCDLQVNGITVYKSPCEYCDLQVNGITMYGKTQEDVVNYLRHVQLGSLVDLIISRPDTDNDDDNDDIQQPVATPGGNLTTVSSLLHLFVLIYLYMSSIH